MTRDTDLTLLFPRSIRTLPADLVAVVVLVFATDVAVFAPMLSGTPLRIVLGLPLVLFVPGYALVAALFPEAGSGPDASTTEPTESTESTESTELAESNGTDGTGENAGTGRSSTSRLARGIDSLERVALSFGLSIAVVPLIGLVLNFTPFGIRLVPIAVCLSAFTLLTAAIAAVRRARLPEAERFSVPYRSRLAGARAELFHPDSRADAALNVLLVVSLLLASASVGYAVVVPRDGERFTEFYLLTENDSGGLVAANYPTNFTEGQSKPLVVGLDNHEGETKRYTVVVRLQRVEQQGNTTTVTEERELRRFRATVANNRTWTRAHEITPTMTGERLRLVYLLYRGAPPRNPQESNAYRELHLWVNVSGSG